MGDEQKIAITWDDMTTSEHTLTHDYPSIENGLINRLRAGQCIITVTPDGNIGLINMLFVKALEVLPLGR